MIIESSEIEDGRTLEADLVIVGSGPAGLSIARAFDGTDTKVILLESGGPLADKKVNALNAGQQSGRKYFELNKCRSRFFGGSSNCWSGWCMPFDPQDFVRRSWLPNSGWPITYEDLVPWYAKANPILQLNAKPYQPERWATKRRPAWNIKGERITSSMFKFSPPTRLGPRYRKQIAESSNVKCVLHGTVTQIALSPNGQTVQHLDVRRTLGGGGFKVKAKRYVLACGGIENPRVLLTSNTVMSQGVGNAHDQVGRYFMEHPHLYGEGRFFGSHKLPKSELYQKHRSRGQRIVAFLNVRPEVRMQEKILNLSMCLRPAGGTTDPLTRAMWRATQETDGGPTPKSRAARRFVLDVRSEQAPNPDSRITLAKKKDALGQQRVDLAWAVTPLDKRSVRRSQEILAQDFARSGLGRFQITLDDSDAFPKKMEGGCHHLGTTRMHSDPRHGVVDGDCRVHGVPNLFVAGSSVFTTGSAANPTLTIVALALRLAATLQEELAQ